MIIRAFHLPPCTLPELPDVGEGSLAPEQDQLGRDTLRILRTEAGPPVKPLLRGGVGASSRDSPDPKPGGTCSQRGFRASILARAGAQRPPQPPQALFQQPGGSEPSPCIPAQALEHQAPQAPSKSPVQVLAGLMVGVGAPLTGHLRAALQTLTGRPKDPCQTLPHQIQVSPLCFSLRGDPKPSVVDTP